MVDKYWKIRDKNIEKTEEEKWLQEIKIYGYY